MPAGPFKKSWTRPMVYLLDRAIKGGSNPNVHEGTAITSGGGPAGPGHAAMKVYDAGNAHFVTNWTAAHS